MKRARVVVGMSGGVDSAVSALLLKRRGFDVVAVHMINWDALEEGSANCPQSKDEADARRVCSVLDIPFRTVNFVKEYWNEVFLNFLDNYRRGRTVVPDIACNRHIKFHHFDEFARRELNADFVATGHYASTSAGDFQENFNDKKKVSLLAGLDPLKDQSYFLCTVQPEQLRQRMFPVGSMLKSDVKRLAIENGLDAVAKKPESMGICFVGKKTKFDRFIDEYIEPRGGDVVDVADGAAIGHHDGIHHFTLGKRVQGRFLRRSSHVGYFVADVDEPGNKIYVCEGSHHASLYASQFVIVEPEWISEPNMDDLQNGRISCRIQRTHSAVPCIASRVGRRSGRNPDDSELRIVPRIPLRAAAPGQMCVFYRGRECLGGGEVLRIEKTLYSKHDCHSNKDK